MPVRRVGEASHPGPPAEAEGFPEVGQRDDDETGDPWLEPPRRWECTWTAFQPADEFEGAKDGMCFRRGDLGQ